VEKCASHDIGVNSPPPTNYDIRRSTALAVTPTCEGYWLNIPQSKYPDPGLCILLQDMYNQAIDLRARIANVSVWPIASMRATLNHGLHGDH
jgi:hypothetical protein